MTAESTIAPARHEPALLGQTVVVIGGSAGIGLETARRAREECGPFNDGIANTSIGSHIACATTTGRRPDR